MFNPAKFVARALLGAVFINGGIGQLKAPDKLGSVVEAEAAGYGLELPTAGQDLVTLNGAGMVAAGTAMTLGILPRTSAATLAGMMAPTTVIGHPFWKQEDPGKRAQKLSSFLSNVAIIGGLMMVAMDRKK
ncbi:putative membrane protein YphA (DoxX/SURF4 family) [Luteococcus japonicus]|jgi:putative oxidoreductase|uniref:DoxX family protein n=2 Tax=Luteococcus japonicus TaxID=33984 RepID=A0A1R4KJQ0_9ACTN|nr:MULTISPECIES: DoxX family protein [Luteococcus]MDN5562598.1 DoxX family protein [Luteococcus sp.]ROR55023.1 putative membrane protein YphA (DoxX/SURF4 family) [Luteococcus japonicus]SJN44518.1 hypothetical protein FM114_15150 [Luteococcus japonicus LSP_Lj1]